MLRSISTYIVLLFLASLVHADPIGCLIKNAGNSEDFPGAGKLIIFDSTYSDVQETGLTYVYTHRLYKVLTSQGALDLNTITYGYDPLSAYVEIRKVLIYRNSGEVEELDIEYVQDYPAPARAIYWGASEKMIEVGRLEPGEAVEVFLFRKGFTYALLAGDGDDDMYIPPMRGHFYDIIEFWSSDPVLEKVYQTSVPEDKLVQYETYNGELKTSVWYEDGKMVYTFSKKDIMPMKREPSMVALSDVAPKLLISSSPDWYAKSLWFYNVNEDYGSFDVSSEVKEKVDEILKGRAKTEMDSISLLTHWVADEVRYSGISMGPGEGYTLHKGDMTFLDRCGVCKDKAGMLVTMLRAAGFESYPAMTMAGSRIDYIPADQFNHSVTVVKLRNGEYKLLDPTWVPFLRELWSSAEQQQNYLLGVPEGADLGITPLSPPENHYFKIRGKSVIKKDGSLQGSLVLEAEGQSDGAIRGLFTRALKSTWDQNVERELKRKYPLMEITSIDYDDPYDYLAGPIQLRISYNIPDFAVITEEEMIFTPVIISGIFMRGMSHMYMNVDNEERMYPFRDRCSRLVELHESIKLPAKVSIAYVPEEEEFEAEPASFQGGYILSKSGTSLMVDEKVVLKKRIYEKEDWGAFRKAVSAQQRFASEPVILKFN
jgi:transglutaminase-like putative cysteine protease